MKPPNRKLLSARQWEAVEKLSSVSGGMLWWKVGEGKTRIAIAWFARLCQTQPAPNGYCVCVVRRKSFLDWYNEIKLLLPNVMVFTNDAPALIFGAQRYAFLLVSDGKLVTLQNDLAQAGVAIKAVVLDEGWLYANHESQRSIAAKSLTEGVPSLIASGTIMKARDTLEMYSQAMAVNKQQYCAKSPTAFRTEYQLFFNRFGWPTYTPKAGSKAKILQKFEPVSDYYFPESRRTIINQFHEVEATDQQLMLFKQLKDEYSASFNDQEFDFNNTLATVVKAQQIANGWFQTPDGDILPVETYKVEKLQNELESIISSGSKCVVWCAFRHDVKMLAAALPFATVQMLGGQDFDTDLWNRSDTRVCLATEASGSAVNHFSQVAYAIYFSANHKWKDMQQSRGRTERTNTKHSICYYKYIQVVKSLDSHVYKAALDSGRAEQNLIALQKSITNWLNK